MASRLASVSRRLDALEAQLGHGGEDFGPTTVIVFTRFWHGADPTASDADERRQNGAQREQYLIDQALAEVRAEARRRRIHVEHVMVSLNDRDQVELSGVPWLPAAGPLAWVSDAFREGT